MKNQYFGDVNDYRKYGLLRVIAEICQPHMGICWMLTADDGRTDGKFTSYLRKPGKWRHYDPYLYDTLAVHLENDDRRVEHTLDDSFLPNSTHYLDYLTDDLDQRTAYMQQMLATLNGSDLLFFDPDNGMQVTLCTD